MNNKLVSGLAVAGLLAGGAGGASAAAAVHSGATAGSRTVAIAHPAYRGLCAGRALQPLVSNGTITQSQATAIENELVAQMRDRMARLGGRGGDMGDHMHSMWSNSPMAAALRQLVNSGTITQSQATAVAKAMTRQMGENRRDGYGPGMMGGGWRGGDGPGMMGP